MRCRNCQRLGHTIKYCSNPPVCANCSLPPHDPNICTRTMCANCFGEHSASANTCPKYLQTNEIIKIKTLTKYSMAQATKTFKNNSNPVTAVSYAETARSLTNERIETNKTTAYSTYSYSLQQKTKEILNNNNPTVIIEHKNKSPTIKETTINMQEPHNNKQRTSNKNQEHKESPTNEHIVYSHRKSLENELTSNERDFLKTFKTNKIITGITKKTTISNYNTATDNTIPHSTQINNSIQQNNTKEQIAINTNINANNKNITSFKLKEKENNNDLNKYKHTIQNQNTPVANLDNNNSDMLVDSETESETESLSPNTL